MEHLLEVKDLAVSFYGDLGETKAVKNASFYVDQGEVFGIVGESGSGKSVATKSILKLGPENCKIIGGSITFQGESIIEKEGKELRAIRGNEISIVFQDSLSALNPVYTIGSKMVELLRRHNHMTKKEAYEKSVELLTSVGIADARKHMKSYPHELSGGMRQRVMIAMAISSNPKLMIADEPTTALDVTIQAQILHLLRDIQKKTKMSVIMITHDLGVVAQMCSRIAVMCGGYVVEQGSAEDIFYRPQHPYTQALIASMPKVGSDKLVQFLERNVSEDGGDGLCPFYRRCRHASEACAKSLPAFYESEKGHFVLCHVRGIE
ncbi:MAG: ABC transporter ATP-binding protein [Lachnospiraceae bacterium]|nr:ABC transporter ATP-binding protein [Robinsoniella sp.]MDY3765265.1 ABC transporter ATP-binding protein [Lachnospiraceae bacterium]